jgi:hypothetical protein
MIEARTSLKGSATALAAVAAASSATAADVSAFRPSPVAAPSWEGWYAGASLGASWLSSNQDPAGLAFSATGGFAGGTPTSAGGAGTTAGAAGWMIGLQGGTTGNTRISYMDWNPISPGSDRTRLHPTLPMVLGAAASKQLPPVQAVWMYCGHSAPGSASISTARSLI